MSAATIHDLPPLSALSDAQLAALVGWTARTGRELLECAARNRMALDRIEPDDVRRALEAE